MKKKKAMFSLLLALTLALAGTISAQAMLSEEEQKEAYVEKAVKEALGMTTEADSKSEFGDETETETAAETADEQTETEIEAVDAQAETESEGETESGSETESETETIIVAINPGHQAPQEDMTKTEPVGPGSDTMKEALTEGASGVETGTAEYELNLEVSLKLKEELESRGYEVVMTRETNDVDTGSAERCEMVNESGAQILIHIHANRNDDSSVRGASATVPSSYNSYTTAIYQRSNALADIVLDSYCEETGLTSRGLEVYDESAGLNWSEIPSMILELGYMTNAEEDVWMADESHQESMAKGIADGVDLYFGEAS